MKKYLIAYMFFVFLLSIFYFVIRWDSLGVPEDESQRLGELIIKSEADNEIPFSEIPFNEGMYRNLPETVDEKFIRLQERIDRIHNNYRNDPMMFRERYKKKILLEYSIFYYGVISLLIYSIIFSFLTKNKKYLVPIWPIESYFEWIMTVLIFMFTGLAVFCFLHDMFLYLKFGYSVWQVVCAVIWILMIISFLHGVIKKFIHAH